MGRRSFLFALALVLLFARPAHAWQVTWLGHAGFVVTARNGATVLIDPWLANPRFPRGYHLPSRVDAILVSHGHFDHAGSAMALSRQFHAPLVGAFELVTALQPREGPAAMGANIGGTVPLKGLRIALVPAVHSSGLADAGGAFRYAGNPVGFVLMADGEVPLLHAGDTALTQEFKTIRELYAPQVALLPIGGWFTMDPAQAATAAEWLGVKAVVPMHYGTFPALSGTPAQLRQALGGRVQVLDPEPGRPFTL